MAFSSPLSPSPKHWLAVRARCAIVGAFVISTLAPPYLPQESLAFDEEQFLELPQVFLVEEGFLLKSSPLTEQSARLAYAAGIIHTVAEGENIERLAQRYGIQGDTIRWANALEKGAPIRPGQELLILPVDGVLHTVQKGQTLAKIADLYGIAQKEIASRNKVDGGFIVAGQELIIPGGKPLLPKPQQVAARPPAQREPKVLPMPPPVTAQPTRGVLQMPCNNCRYTQYYRPGHYAVDIQTKGGGPIFAAEDGTVIRAAYGWNGGFGNVIEVDHGNGLVTLYAHCKELYVQKGERVKRGQAIAWMGNTGRVYGQTGIHVHFEVRAGGIKRNPLLYVQ